MTEKAKELIESVKTHATSWDYGGTNKIEMVKRSDFSRIVEQLCEENEKLTKWNKLKDGFPDTGRQLLVKFRDGDIETAWYLSHKYRGCSFYSRREPDIDFILEDIIEWKYIN